MRPLKFYPRVKLRPIAADARRLAQGAADQRARSILLMARLIEACEDAADIATRNVDVRVRARWSRYQLRATRNRLAAVIAHARVRLPEPIETRRYEGC
jgi:hypothetical protein